MSQHYLEYDRTTLLQRRKDEEIAALTGAYQRLDAESKAQIASIDQLAKERTAQFERKLAEQVSFVIAMLDTSAYLQLGAHVFATECGTAEARATGLRYGSILCLCDSSWQAWCNS